MRIINKTYARVALVGNPSDGFEGKTIATPIKDFYAQVTLIPARQIIFAPDNQDKMELEDMAALAKDVQQHGYYGGLRLVKASVKKFYDFCQKHNIELDSKKPGFKISYQTNIPRQMGLGGSSAIIISCLKALIEYCEISNKDLPLPILANLALSIETEELDISAGLQDRVVQSYNSPIYMDFSKEAFAKNNGQFGNYQTLDKKILPKLFLIYSNAPSESGKVHHNVGFRFKKGEPLVIKGMQELANLTDQALEAMKIGDYNQLRDIFNKNFEIRRKIYTDAVIGQRNLKMIALPRRIKLCSKFSGSGGAIIGIWQTKHDLLKLRAGCKRDNFKLKLIKL